MTSIDASNHSAGVHGAKHIDIYADIWCPFTHVGLRRLVKERDARALHTTIRVYAWPLEFINGRPLDPQLAATEIAALRAAVSPDLFAGFTASRFPTTTIPALGLAAAAYRLGDDIGEKVSLRVRDAVFEEGRDIGDDAELRTIGREFGVEPMERSKAEAAVRADWERGTARGVQGSPHFFAGNRDWFCPSLRIRHEGSEFDISVDVARLDDFYATALT